MTATLVETDVEIRSGDGYQIAAVDFPKRTVTVIAMPYERPAVIDGRFTEVVSRGAFNGIEKRTGQIRANRDHSWDKVVGKIVGLHPSRQEGLVAEVKMFSTQEGSDTLTLCDEGGLDASAGFYLLRRDDGRVYEDAEVWERNHTVRRLNRLRLDHLAFVPNPAYDAAKVLSVRKALGDAHAPLSGDETPNRDWIAYQTLKARYEEINRRYL